jgi:hypothetical protein
MVRVVCDLKMVIHCKVVGIFLNVAYLFIQNVHMYLLYVGECIFGKLNKVESYIHFIALAKHYKMYES